MTYVLSNMVLCPIHYIDYILSTILRNPRVVSVGYEMIYRKLYSYFYLIWSYLQLSPINYIVGDRGILVGDRGILDVLTSKEVFRKVSYMS